MPMIRQKFIYRSDLRSNPDILYLFGDNEQRIGLGGQAKEMRGEPNAVGVRTKRSPGMDQNDFWNEGDPKPFCTMIDEDLRRVIIHVQAGGTIVVPGDGLGTGFSELPKRAPKTYAYLERALAGMVDLARRPLVMSLANNLEWALDEIDMIANRETGFAYPHAAMIGSHKIAAENYIASRGMVRVARGEAPLNEHLSRALTGVAA